MKKTISLILTVVILALSVPVLGIPTYASAEDFTYEINDDGATVTGYTGSASVVNIPDILGGVPVTALGEKAFYSMTYITNVTMPDTVTEIGFQAFVRCTNISSMQLSANLVSIGERAFASLKNLNSIQLPDKLQSIGSGAFTFCEKLSSIKIPDSVAFAGKYCFSYCTGLTDVEIGSGLTALSDSMFSNCTALTSVKIPGTVTYMGNAIFSNCTSLTTVMLPEIDDIPKETFRSCSSLVFVSVPQSVSYIGESAFLGCSSYKDISWLNRNIIIGVSAFRGCSSIDILDLSGPTNIGKEAFRECTNIKTVVLGNSVTQIDDYAFEGCNQLTYVQIGIGIGKSEVNIGIGAFTDCSSLLCAEINSNVSMLNNGAFSFCPKMTTFIGKGNIREFGASVFANSSQLKCFEYSGAQPQNTGETLFAVENPVINPYHDTGYTYEDSLSNNFITTNEMPYGLNNIIGAYRAKNTTYLSARDKEVYNAAVKIINECNITSSTNYGTKIKKIHDWIAVNVKFDYVTSNSKTVKEKNPDSSSEYGALVKRLSVCKGYAKGFQLLMEMLGVNCLTYGAYPKPLEIYSVGHAWNMVQLDSGWFYIDVCWDACTTDSVKKIVNYDYFMKTESEFIGHSQFKYSYINYPQTPSNNAYYNYQHICDFNRGALANVITTTKKVAKTCCSAGYSYDINTNKGYVVYHSFELPTNHTGGAASCSSRGVCTKCNKVYGGYNLNNHNNISVIPVAPTCTMQGYSRSICDDCGQEIAITNYTEALGHSGGTATCTSHAICTVCGAEYGDVNPDNHNFIHGVCSCGLMIGDLSLDNIINGQDSNYMMQVICGMKELTYSYTEAISTGKVYFYVADINRDGVVNVKDNNLLNQVLNGMYTFSD